MHRDMSSQMTMAKSLATLKVLVVDDDYFSAMETSRWLTAAGACVCGPVPSNATALSRLRNEGETQLAVVETELRDGPAITVITELELLGIPFVLTGAPLGWNLLPDRLRHRPFFLTPLTDREARALIQEIEQLMATANRPDIR
jgi:hypothetical protein